MEIPPQLRSALDAELSTVPPRKLAATVAALSERYRSGTSRPGDGYLHSQDDIAAYLAYRLPATLAAVHACLEQVRDRLPDWEPRSLLDAGAGPGTVMWAAAALWPGLARATLLEKDDGMIAAGKRLAAYSSVAATREANWLPVDMAGPWEADPHDLVVMSYALGELPQARVAGLLHKLWMATRGVMVVIEPGTMAGFARAKQARQLMLEEGAHVIAPCPHDTLCPLKDDWCHFSQRIERSRTHRQAKAGELGYEDEKFSFVAVSRTPALPIRGRVLRHPQVRPGHIRLEVCTPDGLVSTVVTRKDRDLYRKARHLRWGSIMPAPSKGREEHRGLATR